MHGSILRAIRDVGSGKCTAESGSIYLTQAYQNWSAIWTKQHWAGLLGYSLALIPTVAIPLLLRPELGKPGAGFALLGTLSVWVTAMVLAYRRSLQSVTWEEVRAIRPALTLSQNQSLYLDCVDSVLSCRLLEESQKASWLASLSASLDQAIELEKLYAGMRESIGGATVRELEADCATIEQKLDKAQDAASREIYRQVLDLAQARLRGCDALSSQLERAEAHLELTRLTFIRTREMLVGLAMGAKRSTQIDLEPLRANLADVQQDANSIRAAIDELAQFQLVAF